MTRWDNGGFWPIDGDTRRDPGGFQLVMLSSGTMVVGKGEGRAGLSSAASPRTGARRGGGFRPGLDTLAERGQAWRRPGVAQGVVKDRRRESQQGACGGEARQWREHCARPCGMSWQRAEKGSAGTWYGRIGVRCDVPSRRSCGDSRRGRGPRRRLLQSEKDGASTGRGGWAGQIAARVFVVVEHNAILPFSTEFGQKKSSKTLMMSGIHRKKNVRSGRHSSLFLGVQRHPSSRSRSPCANRTSRRETLRQQGASSPATLLLRAAYRSPIGAFRTSSPASSHNCPALFPH